MLKSLLSYINKEIRRCEDKPSGNWLSEVEKAYYSGRVDAYKKVKDQIKCLKK